MKTFMTYCGVFIVMCSFTSCDKIDELTEYDFNTTLTESFNVTVAAGANTFNDAIDVNMVNSDTQEYMALLQDVSITNLTYRITNFNGDIDGTIVGSFLADGQTLETYNGVVSTEVGTVVPVSDVGTLNTIASKLKSGQNVIFALTGTGNCDPAMTFTIEITIDLAITADVL